MSRKKKKLSRIKPGKRNSLLPAPEELRREFDKRIETESGKHIHFNFKYLDISSYEHQRWEPLIQGVLDRLKSYSSMTVAEASRNSGNSISQYDYFPEHSEFTCPPAIPEDAAWASVHVQGRECLAGFMNANVFYIVFFDPEHRFWPTKR